MIRTPSHQDRPGTLELFQVFEITTPEKKDVRTEAQN